MKQESIEGEVQAIWRKLDSLGLVDPKLLQPMRYGILECSEKLQAIVEKVA